MNGAIIINRGRSDRFVGGQLFGELLRGFQWLVRFRCGDDYGVVGFGCVVHWP